MKLTELKIENFRSFKEETILFDDYTCLVGPNGTGKSAVLMALNVFFRNNESTVTDVLNLTKEDFHHENVQKPVRITLTFEELPKVEDFSEKARNLLELYARHGKLILFAEAKWDEVTQTAPVKQYGSRLVMEEFAPYFEAEKKKALVRDLRPIYADIRKKFPELPAETRGPQMREALRNYEESLPKERKKLKDEPNELYGFTGGLYRLEDLVQWVYVPAVKDASSEQEEGSKTALGQLLQRTIRNKIDFDNYLSDMREDVTKKYEAMLKKERDALTDLQLSIQKSLQDWTNPRARLNLNWHGDPEKSVQIKGPVARALIGDDAFIGEIARLGHGMQRGFLVAILTELVHNEKKGGPKLLLGFEEPELYQHPPQAQYMNIVLEKLSQPENNAQVIITTHSPYFVSSKGFENIRMFRKCGQRPFSKVSSTTYSGVEKRLSEILGEKPKSPTKIMAKIGQIMQESQKELFFTLVAVLVEGLEDIAYISTYLGLTEQLDRFRELGCHFIVAEGKPKISWFLAIAQELGIPVFVVLDSDIWKLNKKIQRATDNGAGDAPDPEKIEKIKRQIVANEKENKCILELCSVTDFTKFGKDTIWEPNVVVWVEDIGTTVRQEVGNDNWIRAENYIRRSQGLEGVSSKNGMVIAATLEKLYNESKLCASFEKLCANLLQYAERVDVSRRESH